MSVHSGPPPHSCHHCEKLFLKCREENRKLWDEASNPSPASGEFTEAALAQRIRAWINESEGDQFRNQQIEDAEQVGFLDLTPVAAMKAAEEGCSFCKWLLEAFRHDLKAVEKEWDGAFQSSVVLFAVCLSGDRVSFGSPRLRKRNAFLPQEQKRKEREKYYVDVRPYSDLDSTAVAGNPAAGVILTRPINVDPGSLDSLKSNNDWLQACLRDHQACQNLSSKYTPTRLIQIVRMNNHSAIRLIETSLAGGGPYAVLSYCWGNDNHLITTRDSIQRHKVRINKQDLPHTLQDAVLVTENLGLDYLWIDSLCIVQDDDDDKAWEIDRMPSVYSQAVVTITASRASQVQEGFLQLRKHPDTDHPELIFQLSYRCCNGDVGSVILSPYTEEPTQPLDERAWALQERFMSTRMLDYGSFQTRWTCPQVERRENITDGFKNKSVYNEKRSDDTFNQARAMVLASAMSFDVKIKRSEDVYECWKTLLEAYTSRALTKPTDRLLAFSGIAARFAKILNDDYVAGLWRSRLLTGELFWSIKRYSGIPQPRPSTYQGPSWSWAGVNSTITFDRPPEKLHKDFKVIGCQVELSNKANVVAVEAPKYGAVISGILEVQGLLRCATWTPNENEGINGQTPVLRILNCNGLEEDLGAKVTADAIEDEFNGGGAGCLAVSLLVLAAVDRSHGQVLSGLVLRQKENAEYSRLGVFETSISCLDLRQDFKIRKQIYSQQVQWFHQDDAKIIRIV